MLSEELRTLSRLRFTALFGGIFCLLFLMLLLLAIADHLAGGRIGDFLHFLIFERK